MEQVTLNYAAIIVTTLISIVISFVWYLKPVFGKQWMKLANLTDESIKSGATVAMSSMLVLSFVTNYVLAHFVQFAGATDWWNGAVTGLWIWLGFVGAITLSNVLFEKRPFGLFVINAGYQLVNLIIAGAILAAW